MSRKYIIAENGESDYHIVANQYQDEAVRYAASELQKYLLKATGAVVPYFSDRCPSRGPEICVGPAVRGCTETAEELCEEGFRIFGRGENIYIIGNTPRGTVYGVYYFLKKFCGFACFTREVEIIDTMDVLEIELDELAVEPAFEFRDTYFRFAFDGDFCAKNYSNTSLGDLSRGKGGRMKWYNFHHSFRDLVRPELYFEEHPEYFSEIGGERVADSQLCLTNPKVSEIAEQTLRRWIKENPECRVFSIGQNDNKRRCTCKNCMALEEKEGSPAGPVIHFVNGLADAIAAEYPEILLHTFAYQYTLPAPKHVVARENVIVRLCSIDCRFDRPFTELAKEPGREAIFVQALEDWRSHASRLYVWDYVVSFHNYLVPFFNLRTIQKNVRYFRDIGIRGMLSQGNFAYGGGAAMDELKSYVISNLLWDPDLDVAREIHRFCQGVFGPKAGEKIEEYFYLMMDACETGPLTIREYPDATFLNDELIEKSESLFEEALALAENEVYRERVHREQLSVRFLRITRLPLETVGREQLVEDFIKDVKRHGITEIRERCSLAVSKRDMLESRYVRDKKYYYSLYYIMQ